MRSAAAIAVVARRELAAYFHSPIALIVGALFLVLQGFSLWAVVKVLADPGQPAPVGAVLAGYFGGTFLWWTVVLVLVAALAMRLVAEDKQQGTWEALLTAPVAEGVAVLGKWLGSLGFYAAVWVPTLAYPVIIAVCAPPEAELDIGPMVSSYLGVVAVGAALLAIGLVASAATASQLIAAVTGFGACLSLLLVGQLGELAPRWLGDHPTLAAVVAHVDLGGHMSQLARGVIATPALVLLASLAAGGLVVASAVAASGRRSRAEMGARTTAAALGVVILVCANVLAARHPVRWDVTRNQLNSLDPRTRAILAQVATAGAATGREVTVQVVPAGLDAFGDLQREVDRLLDRMIAAQPLLVRRMVDPALEPGRVEALATEFAMAPEHLRDGGVVLFQRGDRRRAVDVLDMAEFATDDVGAAQLVRFRAEEVFASAIRAVIDPDRPVLCHTTGHGEMALSEHAASSGSSDAIGAEPPDWRALGRHLEQNGARLEAIARLATGVPGHCRVLIVAGPRRPLEPRDARAVADYLARGGRLLLALHEASPGATPTGPAAAGLELVLAEYGVAVPAAVVVDPEAAVDTPLAWYTTTGYGDHPVTASFRDRRLTLWLGPRPVVVAGEPSDSDPVATILVHSSERGYAATDLVALAIGRLPERDPHAPAGSVPIALAVEAPDSGARLIVVGAAYSLSSAVADTRAAGNQLLAVAAIDWLAGKRDTLGIAGKVSENVRLLLGQGALAAIFVAVVLVLPAGFALLGALIAWRRRRA